MSTVYQYKDRLACLSRAVTARCWVPSMAAGPRISKALAMTDIAHDSELLTDKIILGECSQFTDDLYDQIRYTDMYTRKKYE